MKFIADYAKQEFKQAIYTALKLWVLQSLVHYGQKATANQKTPNFFEVLGSVMDEQFAADVKRASEFFNQMAEGFKEPAATQTAGSRYDGLRVTELGGNGHQLSKDEARNELMVAAGFLNDFVRATNVRDQAPTRPDIVSTVITDDGMFHEDKAGKLYPIQEPVPFIDKVARAAELFDVADKANRHGLALAPGRPGQVGPQQGPKDIYLD